MADNKLINCDGVCYTSNSWEPNNRCVTLHNGDGYNEHSMILVEKNMCHVCGKEDVVTISTDNSEGDNPWVSMCQECCVGLFERVPTSDNTVEKVSEIKQVYCWMCQVELPTDKNYKCKSCDGVYGYCEKCSHKSLCSMCGVTNCCVYCSSNYCPLCETYNCKDCVVRNGKNVVSCKKQECLVEALSKR
jgi:hypothetical protein